MNRLASFAVLLFLCLLLANCSGNFNQEWDRAIAAQHKGIPNDITGAWLGTWHSDANGHHGELRCVVSREDHDANNYRFHYHATYGQMLNAAYVVTEQVKRKGDHFVLTGEHDLGYLAGGLYHYEGTSTTREMRSTYRSSADHGTFELKRP
jgi:hypothetical protein